MKKKSPDTTRNAPWPTTLWPLVRELDEPGHKELASEVLATKYWRPVYAFLRKKGFDPDRASDLTQDFFLALFEKDWALRADESKGKFRTFLATVLSRYVRDLEVKKQDRFERQQKSFPFEMGEGDRRLFAPQSSRNPEDAFWLQYVRDLLDRALVRLREESEGEDGGAFEVFRRKLDAIVEGKPAKWETLGAEAGLTTDQARYAFQKSVQRFRRILSSEMGMEGEDNFAAAFTDLLTLVRRE
ncbi:MAG: RNA polymerase sigma factor [Planctomycetota bacterium]|jgi:RNA polymerase sigma-70 factor (ECF subfamily)